MGYTLAQVRGYLAAGAALERESILRAAISARAGGVLPREWASWLRTVNGAGAGQ